MEEIQDYNAKSETSQGVFAISVSSFRYNRFFVSFLGRMGILAQILKLQNTGKQCKKKRRNCFVSSFRYFYLILGILSNAIRD